MIKNSRYRRLLVSGLILLGGVILFFAPSSPTEVWVGAAFVCVGILIEIIGITIAHRGGKA
jgi:uncharacterized membrane protein YdjX (TVP38/TMEM64 family)